MVKSLEGIPRKGKLKVAQTSGNCNILGLNHDLVFILNSDSSADWSSIISQFHPEPNVLTWDSRIRRHIQVFDQ